MRTDIYTLDRDDLTTMSDVLPEYVIERAKLPGYFSLGAVGKVDDDENLLGMAQFYINITSEGECFAQLVYIYVLEEYRHRGVASKLIERVNRILKKSDVKTCITYVPDKDVKIYGQEISAADLENFFKECSFISTKESSVVWWSDLGQLSGAITEGSLPNSIRFLKEIDDAAFSSIMDELIEKAPSDSPLPEDIKLDKSEYDNDHSVCIKSGDGTAMLLLHRLGVSSLEIVILRGYGKDELSMVKGLLAGCVKECKKDMSDDTLLILKERALTYDKSGKDIIPGVSEVKVKKFVRLTSR